MQIMLRAVEALLRCFLILAPAKFYIVFTNKGFSLMLDHEAFNHSNNSTWTYENMFYQIKAWLDQHHTF